MDNLVINLKEWENIRGKINAGYSTWTIKKSKLRKIHEEFSEGAGITWSQVHKVRELWRSEVPFIDEEGNPFVLYIYDQSGESYNNSWYRRNNHGPREYKYHFTWCQALEMMSQAGRRARYKAKYDLDNNVFTTSNGSNENRKEMNVCRFCLGNFNYENYSSATKQQKDLLYNKFEPAVFFSNNLPQNLIRPSHPFHSGRYTQDWREVSQNIKTQRGNKCEECGTNSHLQVHHIDGVKDNNNPGNLRVLCYHHHSKQPYHQHMIKK